MIAVHRYHEILEIYLLNWFQLKIMSPYLMDQGSILALEESQVKKDGIMTESHFILTQVISNDHIHRT